MDNQHSRKIKSTVSRTQQTLSVQTETMPFAKRDYLLFKYPHLREVALSLSTEETPAEGKVIPLTVIDLKEGR